MAETESKARIRKSQPRAFRTIAFFHTLRIVELLESVLYVEEVKLFMSSRSRRLRGAVASAGTMLFGRVADEAKSHFTRCLVQFRHDGRPSSHCKRVSRSIVRTLMSRTDFESMYLDLTLLASPAACPRFGMLLNRMSSGSGAARGRKYI